MTPVLLFIVSEVNNFAFYKQDNQNVYLLPYMYILVEEINK